MKSNKKRLQVVDPILESKRSLPTEEALPTRQSLPKQQSPTQPSQTSPQSTMSVESLQSDSPSHGSLVTGVSDQRQKNFPPKENDLFAAWSEASLQTLVNEPVAIQVEKEPVRPFELGDLMSRKWIERNSSFVLSLVFHVAFFLLMSAVLVHSAGKAMIVLELITSPDLEFEDGNVTIPDLAGLEESIEFEDDDLLEDMFEAGDGGQPLSDTGDLAGADTKDGTPGGTALGDGKSAKFFGMRAIGKSFVFVLDQSGSMGRQGETFGLAEITRFKVARNELMKSIDSLRPEQEFYVVLFSDDMTRMLDDSSVIPRPLKATADNKKRVRAWLENEQPGGGTDPRKSVQLALKMKPDAIFMLSDGKFTNEKATKDLPKSVDIVRQQAEGSSRIKVNSIAFEEKSSQTDMKKLASASGGMYRFVKMRDHYKDFVESPEEHLRLLDLKEQYKSVKDWDSRYRLSQDLLELLESDAELVRKGAEEFLHKISLNVYQNSVPRMAGKKDVEERKAIIVQWRQLWEEANQPIELSNGSASKLRIVLATGPDALEMLNKVDLKNLTPLEQIAFANHLLEIQKNHGMSDSTVKLLLKVFLELNKNSEAKFSEEYFVKKASSSLCKNRFKKILRNRAKLARDLEQQCYDTSTPLATRISIANNAIAHYPETDAAAELKKVLGDKAEDDKSQNVSLTLEDLIDSSINGDFK